MLSMWSKSMTHNPFNLQYFCSRQQPVTAFSSPVFLSFITFTDSSNVPIKIAKGSPFFFLS